MAGGFTRREFLRAAGSAAAAGMLSSALPWQALEKKTKGTRDGTPFAITSGTPADVVFPQSVASGDPTPSGVIVWTRVAPDVAAGAPAVALEVARDEAFTDIVHQGTIPASALTPDTDFTVRVDLDGLLDADRHYHYRFIVNGTASRTGRCRTLPAADARPDSLKLAVLTCQNWQNGYFTALGHVADEDVDFVIHLGDFIYEYNGDASYNGKKYPGRAIDLPSGAPRMESLEDLRYVWRKYRSDAHLARMLERHTIIVTWDDHEITNDRHFDYEQGRHYGDDEFHLNADAARLDRFFRDGAKTYFEYLPIRVKVDPDAEDPLEVIELYRSFRFGDLAEVFMLDERWYRSAPPPSYESVTNEGPERTDAARTMLGDKQKQWLESGLRASAARWKVLGNQVQVSPLAATLPGTSIYVNLDAWDGYEADRKWLTGVLGDVENAVVLTGDLHTYLVGYVMRDHNAPLPRRPENIVAVEFMTPGVTSAGLSEIAEQGLGHPPPDAFEPAHEQFVLTWNPHILHFNSARHGYSLVTFTRETATYEGIVVDKSTPEKAGNKWLLSRFEVPAGTKQIKEAYRAAPHGVGAADAHGLTDPATFPESQRVVVKDFHDVPHALERAGPGDLARGKT